MKMNRVKVWFVVGVLGVSGIFYQGTVEAALLTNGWNATANKGGNWGTSIDWSLGEPSLDFTALAIGNAGIKTVTIDATTLASSLTISNLVLSGLKSIVNPTFNTLALTNATTPLTIDNYLFLSGSSAITIDNSSLSIGRYNGGCSDDAVVTLNSGEFLSFGSIVGNVSRGMLIVNGGSCTVGDMYLGGTAGAQGTMIVNAGSVSTAGGVLDIGDSANASGSLWMNGGTLNVDGFTIVGDFGTGQMTVSNGTFVGGLSIGASVGGQGTLTIAGGTIIGTLAIASLDVDEEGFCGTGTVWMTGGSLLATGYDGDGIFIGTEGLGQMTMSNGTTTIDEMDLENGTFSFAGGFCTMSLLSVDGGTVWVTGGQLIVTQRLEGAEIDVGDFAQMTVSNGTIITDVMRLGGSAGSNGTLTVAGGSSSVFSNVTIGSGCASPGTVIVAGGGLFVTNAAHNAVLDLESGALTLSGGTLVVDSLVKTNPCGVFQQTGGTLVIGGVTNLSSSPFQITSIVRTNVTDLLISWNTSGTSNIVQVTAGTGASGTFSTNGFIDVTNIVVTTAATNFYDAGAATNMPTRYYRIRSPQ